MVLWFWKLSDIETFAEFASEITFQVRAKLTQLSPENSMHGRHENDNRQKTAFAACTSWTDARRQYSPPVNATHVQEYV